MSVHEPPQFTPAQVLDAGKRAEAEGRVEFALQFYRHLADQYPGSPEASAAEAALARLGVTRGAVSGDHQRSPPGPPEPVFGTRFDGPRMNASAPPVSLGNPFAPHPTPEPAFGQWQPQYPASPAPAGHQPAYQPEHHEDWASADLPEPRQDYRTGRTLAVAITWLGGFQVLAGLGLLPVAVISPRTLASLPIIGSLLAAPATGAWMLVFGLGQIMLGQLLRAIFDAANAIGDLAAVKRAQSESRRGTPRRSPRR